MGFQYKNICYADEYQAQDAHFYSVQPSFVTVGESVKYYSPHKLADGFWCMGNYSMLGGEIEGCFFLEMPTFTNCTDHSDPTSQFTTGMELGGAVAGAIVIAFLWRYLRVRF